MTLPPCNWHYPTRIWFGAGRLAELPYACKRAGIQRPLLVVDKGLAGLDFVQQTRSQLRDAGLGEACYDEVEGNPRGRHVDAGIRAFLEGDCDGVVGLGGGSALDAAKAVALAARQTLPLWTFEDSGDNWKQADSDRIAPVIAVPTTAGTGSEVGRAAVILDESARRKVILFHPDLLPQIVISDPALCIGLPANLTAWTGIDAFVHALEAYCAPTFHPMADGIAVEAMRMINHWLPRAVAHGDDLEARGQMLVAASMGATAFHKGLGSIHSVSHVLGALYNTHHGLANAVLLPYGLAQNARYIETRTPHLCRALELDGAGTRPLLEHLVAFRHQLGVPHSLTELDIDTRDAEAIGTRAYADPSTPTNAGPVTAADLEALFRAAVAGDYTPLLHKETK